MLLQRTCLCMARSKHLGEVLVFLNSAEQTVGKASSWCVVGLSALSHMCILVGCWGFTGTFWNVRGSQVNRVQPSQVKSVGKEQYLWQCEAVQCKEWAKGNMGEKNCLKKKWMNQNFYNSSFKVTCDRFCSFSNQEVVVAVYETLYDHKYKVLIKEVFRSVVFSDRHVRTAYTKSRADTWKVICGGKHSYLLDT